MKEISIMKQFNILEMEDRYLEYIDVSENTLYTYNVAIKQFALYLKEKGIVNPERRNVIDFRDSLKENHSVSTINTYLIALRNFFKFLQYEGIYKDITENIKNLTDTNLHKRDALTADECKKLLNEAKDLREKTIVALTLSCGLRANEVVNIRISDFEVKNGTIILYVLGKGRSGKQDYVVVPDMVMDIIREYSKAYGITDYLFVSVSRNNTGNKLTTQSIRRIVNKMYERSNLKTDKITLHSLRHSFGTIAIQNGENIRDVSKAMRHKSLDTTSIYLHDLEMINNKCSNTVTDKVLGGIF